MLYCSHTVFFCSSAEAYVGQAVDFLEVLLVSTAGEDGVESQLVNICKGSLALLLEGRLMSLGVELDEREDSLPVVLYCRLLAIIPFCFLHSEGHGNWIQVPTAVDGIDFCWVGYFEWWLDEAFVASVKHCPRGVRPKGYGIKTPAPMRIVGIGISHADTQQRMGDIAKSRGILGEEHIEATELSININTRRQTRKSKPGSIQRTFWQLCRLAMKEPGDSRQQDINDRNSHITTRRLKRTNGLPNQTTTNLQQR
ncbi:hypothetical protein Nepgr_005332 [Nepenthes gracilis]|uniref:Uncharacterized protein n=1 Tax=Nepenthes gracilis TaxID=150966 RepID=A0AAD3XGB4_NEPGR|nr:hypothetical protein Nepgr_005332 [Nepenthes gracilis]